MPTGRDGEDPAPGGVRIPVRRRNRRTVPFVPSGHSLPGVPGPGVDLLTFYRGTSWITVARARLVQSVRGMGTPFFQIRAAWVWSPISSPAA